ncbi:MAG: sigma-70 family RNA polymerase sigma factor, partial [Lachnospiraceae bacterium]|nr:sigma-70 family RNA polymerase sigma factor [Lachnospiraceae bacterium]
MNNNQLNEKIVEVSKTIFSYCMAKTPNRDEAEDLSQDIIYELMKSSKNLRDDNAFYGFMWAVADNVYKQWCRKKARNNICELTDDIPEKENPFEFDDDNNDIFLLRRELSLLSEKYRHATILYYIEQKTCSEISQSLAISESMVKYLLFKSRKILKEGMNMERKLGELSYNPKSLIPMYSGEGPNYFWDFMQSKIRQNIIGACYNDSLTPQQISLETGIP